MSKRRVLLVLIDAAIAVAIFWLLGLLSDASIGSLTAHGAFSLTKLTLFLLCVFCSRGIGGIYSCVWRYADSGVYIRLIATDSVAGILFFMLGRTFSFLNLGFAYHVLLSLCVLLMTLCSRLGYQFLYAYAGRYQDSKWLQKEDIHKINVVIVGAGNVGASLAGELQRNPRAHYNPYCFVDKDPEKIDNQINGLRVYKEDERIVDRIQRMPVQEIIIALPDASTETKAKLYDLYKTTGCKVKLYDYPTEDKRSGKKELRDFRIEDLLFRDALKVATPRTSGYYRNKTVLVTGGGGSIGSELCRQIAALRPKKLIIVDIYENNAYEIQQELMRKYGDVLALETLIASVRDVVRMETIFATYRPNIVFHAAAHKHVPLMEQSGGEAIKNNVLGTYNVANLAEQYGAEKFVLISTDKAVNPTNIMGASKRLCEMVIQCRRDSSTEFAAVRFGNVLGSNGSVIPLFKKQIEQGGPVTITDKRIIRYFMTIPEAVGLVMEAGAIADGGEIFVLDMGNPVKILDLAENMIQLSGLKPYEDIDIVEVGLRPGEKLYEELLMRSEELSSTENKMIFIERDGGYSRKEVEQKLKTLRCAVEKQNHAALLQAIRETVPTYRMPKEVNDCAKFAKEMQVVFGEGTSAEHTESSASNTPKCSPAN